MSELGKMRSKIEIRTSDGIEVATVWAQVEIGATSAQIRYRSDVKIGMLVVYESVTHRIRDIHVLNEAFMKMALRPVARAIEPPTPAPDISPKRIDRVKKHLAAMVGDPWAEALIIVVRLSQEKQRLKEEARLDKKLIADCLHSTATLTEEVARLREALEDLTAEDLSKIIVLVASVPDAPSPSIYTIAIEAREKGRKALQSKKD